MELVNQIKMLANNIEKNNRKIIHIFPEKQREDAYANLSRRLLATTLAGLEPEPSWESGLTMRQWRELAEDRCRELGYTLVEVPYTDYTRSQDGGSPLSQCNDTLESLSDDLKGLEEAGDRAAEAAQALAEAGIGLSRLED